MKTLPSLLLWRNYPCSYLRPVPLLILRISSTVPSKDLFSWNYTLVFCIRSSLSSKLFLSALILKWLKPIFKKTLLWPSIPLLLLSPFFAHSKILWNSCFIHSLFSHHLLFSCQPSPSGPCSPSLHWNGVYQVYISSISHNSPLPP